ncbi:Stabilin-2 [Merluccius polli]|uniref:Stabilin-2 n=1 Tax=Merluccius polli TaxID=89951 RepID=A0AA47NP84_MERPO|nr:Stabilin-2 [Merluccius polli]
MSLGASLCNQMRLNFQGHSKLLGLLRNHIVASARLEVYSVVSSPGVASMANDVLLFNVSQTGRVLVSGVAVLEADVAARNGQLYSLDGVLVPASIQPVLPHRCDVPEVKVVKVSPLHWCYKLPLALVLQTTPDSGVSNYP